MKRNDCGLKKTQGLRKEKRRNNCSRSQRSRGCLAGADIPKIGNCALLTSETVMAVWDFLIILGHGVYPHTLEKRRGTMKKRSLYPAAYQFSDLDVMTRI